MGKEIHRPKISSQKNLGMKKVIYSVITNNYDKVRNPVFVNDDYDYVMFVDQETIEKQRKELGASHWTVINPPAALIGKRLSKIIKVLPVIFLPEYRYSVYFDASIEQIGDINDFAQDSEFRMCHHPRRDCAYAEGAVCVSQGLDDPQVINSQLERYRAEDYPYDNGLVMGGMIARKHNKRTQRINEAWWDEVITGSYRDQLSFNYVLWKLQLEIDLSDYENDIINILKPYPHIS